MDAIDYNDPMISSGEYREVLHVTVSILTSTEMVGAISPEMIVSLNNNIHIEACGIPTFRQ